MPTQSVLVEEEDVLGIPISDPRVLKATQFVLVSVGITAFYFILDVSYVVQRRGFGGFTRYETLLVLIEISRNFALIVSGYVGVKRSSRFLLGAFVLLCLLACALSLIFSSYAFWIADPPEPVGNFVLEILQAAFFAVGAYHCGFLFRECKYGSLQIARDSGATSDSNYSLLGIQMMDLKVLKATQIVFTSLGIMICIFGSVLVVGAEGALSHANIREGWFLCFGIVMFMGCAGYCGVKKSSPTLLSLFFLASCVFASLFMLGFLLIGIACPFACSSAVVFCAGLTIVFAFAAKGSWFLRSKALSGSGLTTCVVFGDNVAPTQLGTELNDLPCGDMEQPPGFGRDDARGFGSGNVEVDSSNVLN
eukprot:TRINITY_DN12994_c0_g1_i1.p1 TRINITY_DN12994_c0_g1~~TRINITY_DN12994_c0_g1_i1.p1  ORF type:complete len:364 (-),score=53.76 TRINITY_DN12994_c0_g1_i1:362-1453(-)